MSRKRTIYIPENSAHTILEPYKKIMEDITHGWELLQQSALQIKDEYWSEMLEQVELIKQQQNYSLAKLNEADFYESTFIKYKPKVREASQKRARIKGKDLILGKHIKMVPSQSPLTPGHYSETQFPLNDYAAWQKQIIIRTENKFKLVRNALHKMAILRREIMSVVDEYEKLFDNHGEVSGPVLAQTSKNNSLDAELDKNAQLVALHDALLEFCDDVNILPENLGDLLMKTPNETLEQYLIDPDLKDMYMG